MKEAFDLIHDKLDELAEEARNFEPNTLVVSLGKMGSFMYKVEAEYGNGWIDVKDRLPENEDEVLVWYEYQKLQGVNIVGRAEIHGIGYYYKPTNSWLIDNEHGIYNRVIAWMPLPEPYRADHEAELPFSDVEESEVEE